MAVSRKQALKKFLSPYGFTLKNNTLYRLYNNECVHTIKNCLVAPGESLIQVAVYSIFDYNFTSYFSSSPVIPYSYNCIGFAGKRTTDHVYLTEDEYLSGKHNIIFFTKSMQPYVYYMPTLEEELDIVQNLVLSRLDTVDSQKRIIEFYDERDMFEYGNRCVSNPPRLYTALALGDYKQCQESYEAIFKHNEYAIRSYKKQFSSEKYVELRNSVIEEEADFRKIQHLVEHNKKEEIQSMLDAIKVRNLDFLK